ncbi:hypothetical protein B0H15DRAFT_809854 [Mycena belliarum]|uniref:Malate dehydrogenase n=1 Tax=Mycena belliarum TaxID=1033014 RepID=A0AAD6Y0A4_9AGAR|nr:hypothetical protein B0H15DRAFT_809854 [Mycena belliae]
MFSFQLLSTLSSVALLVSAAPAFPGHAFPAFPKKGACKCDTSAANMNLPANQTQLVTPTTAPLYVALGVGIQNYTCSSTTLKYTSTGAVASLFDISCLDKTPAFKTVSNAAFTAWSTSKGSANTIGSKVGAANLLGFHYFVPAASGTGISPKWDFTSTGKNAGKADAFVIGAKTGGISAPAPANPSVDVDWLGLKNATGTLASKIYRVDTVNGQPPSSCVAGSADITVKYTAKYFLY